MSRLSLVAVVGVLVARPLAAADLPPAQRTFLATHCFDCHDAESKKGGLDLTVLKFNLQDAATFAAWVKVLDRVRADEMPPRTKRPPADETKALLDALDGGLRAASAAEQGRNGRALARRLNRDEYQNTLRDLLGVEEDYRPLLPADGMALGFDKVGSALSISAEHLQAYMAAAEAALNEAIVTRPAPARVAQTFPQRKSDLPAFQRSPIKAAQFGDADDALVVFGRRLHMTVFSAKDTGWYRLRARARAWQSDQPVLAALKFGDPARSEFNGVWLAGYTDFPPEGREVEMILRLAWKETLHFHPVGTKTGEKTEYEDFTPEHPGRNYKGPGLAIEWVKVEGPLVDEWPPAGHRRLFGELNLAKATRADAARVLRDFLPRAFRRPVTGAELDKFLRLYDAAAAKGGFLRGMKLALQAALCSPQFLFLHAPAGPLDDHALAARLSYFLWSSTPDDELAALAAKGALRDPKVLRAQVERLLAHPKAAGFIEGFTGQWLDLRIMEATTPDARLYPEHDELLLWSSVQETRRFFNEVLQNNLNLTTFVHSGFAMLNERLAVHYELLEPYRRAVAEVKPPGGVRAESVSLRGGRSALFAFPSLVVAVSGPLTRTDFVKVKLPPDSVRGGVLAQASVLKVTANGTTSSPVLRGAWVTDRILGEPVPPPPVGVPAVEPDIRGATTIRAQLAKHRTDAKCASCHAKIDPPGFALESFDVIGGWRDRYRAEADHAKEQAELALPLTFDVARFRRDAARAPVKAKVGIGPAVDAGGEMPGGKAFRGFREFRSELMKDPDRLARALAGKLVVYATGAGLQYADRAIVEEIVGRVRQKEYGFRSLIHEVVESQLFLNQ